MSEAPTIMPFVQTSPITRCWWGKTEGRFNILNPSEKSWKVYIYVEFADNTKICVSQTWDYDDEPNLVDDEWPEEVVEVLAKRLEHWLYSSEREKTRGKIEWMRSNMQQINLAWARDRLKAAAKTAEEAARKLGWWQSTVVCLEEEIAESKEDNL